MTRVADIAQHTRVQGFISSAQSRVNELQTQIGSGRKSQEYFGISRKAERLVSLEATHTRTTQYVKNNQTIERRLQTMESNISQIFDVMTGYKTLLVDALNAQNSADLNMPVRAQEMLNQISSLLNVEEDGRYLFAGSMTNVQPVDYTGLPPTYVVPTVNGASSGYYQGNSQVLAVRAGDNFDVDYGVTANELGFEQAMNALGANVISIQNAGWQQAKASVIASALISEHPNLKAILCANDSMAMGAVAAI